VVLGKQVGKDVIIKEGLAEGDQVVVEGVQNLRQGAVIKTPPPAAAAPAATPPQQ